MARGTGRESNTSLGHQVARLPKKLQDLGNRTWKQPVHQTGKEKLESKPQQLFSEDSKLPVCDIFVMYISF